MTCAKGWVVVVNPTRCVVANWLATARTVYTLTFAALSRSNATSNRKLASTITTPFARKRIAAGKREGVPVSA